LRPKKRIIILGAGLAGLSAAWHLKKKGLNAIVFEKEPDIGGLCRSRQINGFTFDCDGHLLHFRHRYTYNLVKGLLGNQLTEHKRNASIYTYSKYNPYPFQANLYGLPAPIVKECLLEFLKACQNGQFQNKNKRSFLYWINHTFGRGIAKHFMLPYNNKFWTLPADELTCEWLDGFIPVPSLKQVIEGALRKNRKQFGYNAKFWYPKNGGIEVLPLSLASQIKNIYTNCSIREIDPVNKYIKLSSNDKEKFDYLISTIPLPEIPGLIKKLPSNKSLLFKKLKWNSIFNLNLGLDNKHNSTKHWIYYPEKNTCFFRVGFWHNFSSSLAPAGKSSLYIEVSYSKYKPINKKRIVPQIIMDLKKVGLINKEDKICARDAFDIKYGYPIYDRNYAPAREKIISFLGKNNIVCCGRYGLWKYMSMEDAILSGQEAAERIKG